MYKTFTARWLSTGYIVISTLCIFFSMTVIACAQTIACESNVRIFDYAETAPPPVESGALPGPRVRRWQPRAASAFKPQAHVVLMTNILMHGDRRQVAAPDQVRPRLALLCALKPVHTAPSPGAGAAADHHRALLQRRALLLLPRRHHDDLALPGHAWRVDSGPRAPPRAAARVAAGRRTLPRRTGSYA